jgi:lipoate synthase
MLGLGELEEEVYLMRDLRDANVDIYYRSIFATNKTLAREGIYYA